MKFLLDTHTFVWSIAEPKKLPRSLLNILQNPDVEIFVSAISLWEISIKERLGKLTLVGITTEDLIPSAKKMGFQLIALKPEEAATQGQLAENTHFDPFDRMLIWQAISRKLTLVSSDTQFRRFASDGLKVLWQ
ncbi:MAG TPA: PIN domain nuclease [Blastocatellia bacterium]|nr:PIN domain nuclease [Blastocatellia bacterium]